MIWFTSDVPNFPERLAKMIIDGGWFANIRADNDKYIVFRDAVLKINIGNAAEKETVLNEL